MLSTHAKKIIIPFHFLAIFGFFWLFKHPSLKLVLLVFSGWFIIGPLGVGTGYHRLLAHSTFTCKKKIRQVLTFLGALSGQGSPFFWVVLHRHHHEHSDLPTDVHSPNKGLWHAYLGWQLDPNSFSQINWYLGRDLLKEPYQRFFHHQYYRIVWGIFVVLFLISWKLAIFGLAVPVVLFSHEVNLLDTIGHLPSLGYRNYNTSDKSSNNLLLGYLTLGIGFHNNHHANPNELKFSIKWFELDACAWIARLLSKL